MEAGKGVATIIERGGNGTLETRDSYAMRYGE